MKRLIFLFLACILSAAPAIAGNLDNIDIDKEVNSASFNIGCDRHVGCMSYVVDQTNGMCFAVVKQKDASGITQVDCNKLMKIDKIRNFYDTGKADK